MPLETFSNYIEEQFPNLKFEWIEEESLFQGVATLFLLLDVKVNLYFEYWKKGVLSLKTVVYIRFEHEERSEFYAITTRTYDACCLARNWCNDIEYSIRKRLERVRSIDV